MDWQSPPSLVTQSPYSGSDLRQSNSRRSSAPTGRSLGLSRAFSGLTIRRSNDAQLDHKGSLGLEPLVIPAEPIVDFVFVHGLGGGSRKSWTLGNDPALYWPKEWLPRDPEFRDVRIHTFGYDADWADRRTSILDVHDFGRKLLISLHLSERIRRSSSIPIVFVAHSMGGLVVKQAFLLALDDPAYQELGRRFHTLFFLGTPHHGAQSAQLLSGILKATDHGQKPFLDDLRTYSPAIQRINDSFRHHAHKIRLFSFFETKPLSLGVTKEIIVKKDSAILGLPHERYTHLDADHRAICKYDDPDNPNYLLVKKAFIETLDVIRHDWDTLNRDTVRTYKRTLRQFLGITSDVSQIGKVYCEEQRAEGSCEWIIDTDEFRQWRDEITSPTLAVHGLPAMGKTYVADFVQEHLQELGLPCSSFFFQAGDTARSSLSRCLLSLAYDVACYDPRTREAFLEMQHDEVHLGHDQEKPRSIWQKLFVNCILKKPFYKPYYWVVDAVDECKKYDELIPLLLDVHNDFPLRTFLTSRPSDELRGQLLKLNPPGEMMKITPQNTMADIRCYIHEHTRFLDHESPAVREQLADTIIEGSEGCFLWVKLVLRDLKQVQSSKINQKILKQMPKGMDRLYERTLQEMSESSAYQKPLAKAILKLAVCAFRPLSIDELKAALLIAVDDEIQNLARQIPVLCKHLLFVDSENRVRVVHQTVRAFLIDHGNQSEFTFSDKEGHRLMAEICLKYLSGTEMRAPRTRRLSSHRHLTSRSPFMAYAATTFHRHLNRCNASDSEMFSLLSSFLKSPHRNPLTWIEHIAKGQDLSHLTQTGLTLATFLRRRSKHIPALGEDFRNVERWGIDLVRIVTKFGHNLVRAPSSIFNIIPPMCPAESAPYILYGKDPRGISIAGLSSTAWDDRLASLALPDVLPLSTACCENHFAVGISDGHIRMYSASTCQFFASFQHSCPPKILKFNISGQLLLSVGRKLAKVWDVPADQCILDIRLPKVCVSGTFAEDSTTIVLVCLDNRTYTYSITGNSPPIIEQIYENMGHTKIISKPAEVAVFSLDCQFLALSYRGGHINIWNLEENCFEGICEKPDAAKQVLPFHATSMVFNCHVDNDSLAASYEDGMLIVFSPLNGDVKATFKTNAAATLACSKDSRTLVSADASGVIRVFDFEDFFEERLKMFYIIYSHAEDIRALAFCDNLRFIDIRESSVNVWEPAALLRQEADDETSDMASIDLQEQRMPVPLEKDEIVCIDLDVQRGFVFAGTEAGHVDVYSIESTPKCQRLYSHGITIVQIVYNPHTKRLATADMASRVFVRQLTCQGGIWCVGSKLLANDRRMAEPIEELLFSPDGDKLHIVTTTQDDLCSLDGSHVESARWSTRNRGIWITHPRDNSKVLLMTASTIRMYSWNRLEQVTAVPISLQNDIPPDFDLKAVHKGWGGRILITEYSDSIRDRSRTKFFLWDTASITASTPTIRPHSTLQGFGDRLALQLGVSGSMIGFLNGSNNTIVYLNQDGWVCSVEMRNQIPQEYKRHFFFPNDWLSTNDQVLIRCTATGDVVFAKEHELAVIRGGMNVIDSVPFDAVPQ